MPDIPPYAQLKARATELGIRSVGVKGPDLAAAIEAEEARLAANPEAAAEPATEAAAVTDDDEPKRSARNAKAVPIVRQDAIRWWCPVCDFAMPPYMKGCAKCGAARRGDAVIPA